MSHKNSLSPYNDMMEKGVYQGEVLAYEDAIDFIDRAIAGEDKTKLFNELDTLIKDYKNNIKLYSDKYDEDPNNFGYDISTVKYMGSERTLKEFRRSLRDALR